MKPINLFILIAGMLFIHSCSEEMPLGDSIIGEINGMSYESGQANFNYTTSDRIFINIFSKGEESLIDTCLETPNGIIMFFEAEITMDEQPLFLDESSLNAFTVTVVNPNDSTQIFIKEGYFKITSIDSTLLKAELDLEGNADTHISGTFEAELCI